MGEPGFFDLSRRYEGLDAKQDPRHRQVKPCGFAVPDQRAIADV